MSLINDALKRARQVQKAPALLPGVEGILAAPSPLQPVDYADREKSHRLLVVIPVVLLSLGASFWFFWKWKNPEVKAAISEAPPKVAEIQFSQAAQTNALAMATATVAQWEARQRSEGTELPAAKASDRTDSEKSAARHMQATLAIEPAKGLSSVSSKQSGSAPVVSVSEVSPRPTAQVSGNPSGPNEADAPRAAQTAAALANSPPTPALTPAQPAQLPRLQGIFYRLRRPTALINGRIVSLGDDIHGYRVSRIERDLVKLTAAGRTNILRLN